MVPRITRDDDWFFSHIIELPDGCLEWCYTRHSDGYGVIQQCGQSTPAHRWAYERFIGRISEGMVLHHTCNNRACVNPLHLQPMTTNENVRIARRQYWDKPRKQALLLRREGETN